MNNRVGFLAKTLEKSLFRFQDDHPGRPVQTLGKTKSALIISVRLREVSPYRAWVKENDWEKVETNSKWPFYVEVSAKSELTSGKSVNAICKLNKDLLNNEKEEFQVSKGCFHFSRGSNWFIVEIYYKL